MAAPVGEQGVDVTVLAKAVKHAGGDEGVVFSAKYLGGDFDGPYELAGTAFPIIFLYVLESSCGCCVDHIEIPDILKLSLRMDSVGMAFAQRLTLTAQ